MVAVNWKAVGSSLGLVVPNRGSAPALFLFADKLPYYYVILAMALGALAITRRIERSRMGYALAAIRENEDAAEAAGVDALSTKLSAMALSSFLTALGGHLLRPVLRLHRPEPHLRARHLHRQALLPAIVGGAGTVIGPAARLLRADPDLGADPRGPARTRRGRHHAVRRWSSSWSSRSCPTGSWGGSASGGPAAGGADERARARDPRSHQAVRRPGRGEPLRPDRRARARSWA